MKVKIEKNNKGYVVRSIWPFTVSFIDYKDYFIYDVQLIINGFRVATLFTRQIDTVLTESEIETMFDSAEIDISEGGRCEFRFGYSKLHSYIIYQIPEIDDYNLNTNSRTFTFWKDGDRYNLIQYRNCIKLYHQDDQIPIKISGLFNQIISK